MSWYGPGERVTYYTQRNNPKDAAKQCNVTALVTALDGSGVKLPDTKGEQPEAHLAAFAETDERVATYMRELQGWAVRLGWPPYTEQHTLAYAANLWLGRGGQSPIVTYATDTPLETIVADLADNRCSVVTGRFTPGGHMVAIIGVESDQWLPGADTVDLKAVRYWMVHDPWGDYHSGYRDHNGSRCLFKTEEMMRLILTEGVNAKWVHRVVAV